MFANFHNILITFILLIEQKQNFLRLITLTCEKRMLQLITKTSAKDFLWSTQP